QETVNRLQAMQNTFGIVHSLYRDDQSLAFVSETKLLAPAMEFGRIKHFFKVNRVDSDRVNTQSGTTPFASDMRQLCFDAQKALHRVAEMTQVTEGMKADQIRTEHPGHQFAAPGVTAENLVSWKRRVQEKANAQIRRRNLKQRRQKHQL